MISSVSVLSISMSKTSMSAKRLKRTPLPSITGLPARAPMLPRPSTAVPLRDDRDQVALGGVPVGEVRVPGDLEAGCGDPGRVGERQVFGRVGWLRWNDLHLARAAGCVVGERVFLETHGASFATPTHGVSASARGQPRLSPSGSISGASNGAVDLADAGSGRNPSGLRPYWPAPQDTESHLRSTSRRVYQILRGQGESFRHTPMRQAPRRTLAQSGSARERSAERC